jgi:uncharacterized protein (DUF2235 family)
VKKRIVICSDGTWNKPEDELGKDYPTNVLKIARAIKPFGDDGLPQQVFYDWGVGADFGRFSGGITGKGVEKNIVDGYRYIVQNYNPGDEIYLFGFSRGAYTMRALSGFINNCGILKRDNAKLINTAFEHYKNDGDDYAPSGRKSVDFRKQHSHESRDIKFIGLWDTVGAMGIPVSFLGNFSEENEFFDTKLGKNVKNARHALAIDEHREDFEPTFWEIKDEEHVKQVWFAGVHSDIGGSYEVEGGISLSYNSLNWMIREVEGIGLSIEEHLKKEISKPPLELALAKKHESRVKFFKLKRKLYRAIKHDFGKVLIHESVKIRYENDRDYKPKNLEEYLKEIQNWENVDIEKI